VSRCLVCLLVCRAAFMSSSIDVTRGLSMELINCVAPFQMHIYRSLTCQLGYYKYIAF
jgi:hypothetical protein